MREARAEKDEHKHDERRRYRQSHRRGTGRARRAGERLLEEGCQPEEGRAQSQESGQGCRPKKDAKAPQHARARKGAKEERGNKKAEVIGMMRRAKGATIDEIIAVTSWQRHTVRGFVSLLGSKGGLKIESGKNTTGERSYRIAK
jgi:hypothetical protein